MLLDGKVIIMTKEDEMIYTWCNEELSRGNASKLLFSNLDSIEKKYKVGKYGKKYKK